MQITWGSAQYVSPDSTHKGGRGVCFVRRRGIRLAIIDMVITSMAVVVAAIAGMAVPTVYSM